MKGKQTTWWTEQETESRKESQELICIRALWKFLSDLEMEVKCEFTEFADDSKKESTAGIESKYNGRIIRSKDRKNRIVNKFRTSNSLV